MVDRDVKRNRSVSADSELHSAYESFRQGEYKLSLGIVDKKLLKLNSPIDRFNFNILLSLIYSKINRLEDSNTLCEQLKNEMIKNDYLSSFPEICNYFKNILRELDQEKLLKEIFDYQMKSLNLTKIDNKHQKKILKELTLNMELNELYSKINIFLKNENQPNLELLNLLKYEVVYNLCFKFQKLSKFIGSAIFKEMNTKFDILKDQKGFLDIMVKFLIGLNDSENFFKYFENKSNGFTNAPIDDLIINFYFNQKGQEDKLVNHLINSIKMNLDKCNFNNFSRLLCYFFNHVNILFENNSLNADEYSFLFEDNLDLKSDIDRSMFDNINISLSDSVKENLFKIYSLFSFIKNDEELRKKYFNSYKSSIIALLMFWHFIKITFSNNSERNHILSENIEKNIYHLIVELLQHSINKQSTLMEISKYFIYINEEQRQNILKLFCYDETILTTDLTSENKEKIIFYQKLKKLLNLRFWEFDISNEANEDFSVHSLSLHQELNKLNDYIDEITKLYFTITKNSPKLAKGERIVGDDLVTIVNEAFFEFTINTDVSMFASKQELNDKFSEITFKLYCLDFISYEKSPYNYDISLNFLRLTGYMGLNSKLLSILTTMNLKGPQFESVSYTALPYFFNSHFKQGLTYIYGNLDKWLKDNKRCARKTLWKMFTGRNYWDTEELMEFMNENENSYYKFINELHEITFNYLNPCLLLPYDQSKKNELNNYLQNLKLNQKNLESKMNNKALIKNQDVIVNMFKLRYVPYLSNDVNSLKRNINYKEKIFNYKYPIDSVYKNNFIFERTPGFKNNYFLQNDISVFGLFEDENFLNLNFLTNILKVYIKNSYDSNMQSSGQKSTKNDSSAIFDQNYLKETLLKAEILTGDEQQAKILRSYRVGQNDIKFFFNLEKLLVSLFKFDFENGSHVESLENNINILSDTLSKFAESTYLNEDFNSFKNNYKKFNHIAKTHLVTKFKIFSKNYLSSFILIIAKINNFVNINKNLFKNAVNIKNILNANFKSPILNFLKNLESLTNDSDELTSIEKYLNIKEFLDFNNLPSKIKVQIRKNIEENTRDIKDIAKSLSSFLRDTI